MLLSLVRSLAIFLCVLAGRTSARDVPVPAGLDATPNSEPGGFSHALWDRLAGAYVDDDGLVDYASLKADRRFEEYLYTLANTNPADVGGGDDRLAFWVNAYNALVIQGVLETLPKDRSTWSGYSVLDVSVPEIKEPGKGFFQGLRFMVGGHRLTLDEIEKAVLLQYPEWMARHQDYYRAVGPERPDPRIHFALVCAARGCVKLRRGAYDGAKIGAQLDDAVRRFVHDPVQVRFDAATRTMYVSRLLEWYGDDLTDPRFTPHGESVAAFLARFADESALARSLASDTWRAVYLDYDWQLNLRR